VTAGKATITALPISFKRESTHFSLICFTYRLVLLTIFKGSSGIILRYKLLSFIAIEKNVVY